MVRIPPESVAYPAPFPAFDLLVDRAFAAALPKLFVGDYVGPVNTEDSAKASVNEDLESMRDILGDLPRLTPIQQNGLYVGPEYLELDSPCQFP